MKTLVKMAMCFSLWCNTLGALAGLQVDVLTTVSGEALQVSLGECEVRIDSTTKGLLLITSPDHRIAVVGARDGSTTSLTEWSEKYRERYGSGYYCYWWGPYVCWHRSGTIAGLMGMVSVEDGQEVTTGSLIQLAREKHRTDANWAKHYFDRWVRDDALGGLIDYRGIVDYLGRLVVEKDNALGRAYVVGEDEGGERCLLRFVSGRDALWTSATRSLTLLPEAGAGMGGKYCGLLRKGGIAIGLRKVLDCGEEPVEDDEECTVTACSLMIYECGSATEYLASLDLAGDADIGAYNEYGYVVLRPMKPTNCLVVLRWRID